MTALLSSLRQPLQLVWTEFPPFAVSLFQDHDAKRVYQLHDFIESRLIQPNVADCVAGRVGGTDRRYRVIESVLLKTVNGGDSIDPVPADGAERTAIDEPR